MNEPAAPTVPQVFITKKNDIKLQQTLDIVVFLASLVEIGYLVHPLSTLPTKYQH